MSPNVRAKNRRLSSVSFTEKEVKDIEDALKLSGISNRSDLVREAVAEWLKAKGYKKDEGRNK